MLDSLQAVQRQLDATAAAERDAAGEPRLPRDTQLAALVRARLQPQRGRWLLGLCLAAALLLVGALLWSGPAPKAPAYQRLDGRGAVTCEADYAGLRWGEIPGARGYQVVVLAPGNDGNLEEVDRSPTLAGTQWQPTRSKDYGPWIRVKVVVPGVEQDRVVHTADFWRSGQPR
jgi:hypothetical protein